MAVAQLSRSSRPGLPVVPGSPGSPGSPSRSGSAGLAGSPAALAAQARAVLTDAALADTCAERFRLAHLAALRTAAVVFAQRGRPGSRRRGLVSAWVLLHDVAPEYREWAAYFAAAAPARAAVEAGAVSAVTERDADDQLRAATQFLHIVESSIGLLPLAG